MERASDTVTVVIKTPDQRLRVFISSTIGELAEERAAARAAIESLKLTPILFELGARSHPPQALYRSYLEQSHIFVGIYWQSYGWVAPDMEISGLEDEYRLATTQPKLIYIKESGAERDERLERLIERIRDDDRVSYKHFSDPGELAHLIKDDLALLLTERFERATPEGDADAPVATSNLPALVNLFVGRDAEMEALRRMVLDEGHRLVTLLGPGGIGKSRLALEFAESVRDTFVDGAYLVLLQDKNDPELVVPTIAQTLNIEEVAGLSVLDVLTAELRTKQILLVLDNFEHLLDGADDIATLLAESERVVMIVTSRSPLNVRAEHGLTIDPLEVVADRGSSDAMRLFIDRATAAQPNFDVTEQNQAAIAEICRRLDGIPLAIELAAARVRTLTPESMLARLNDRFKLLTGGWRDLPERHQTLRSTIDWSFDLLDDDEKLLFERASVFNGGWSLAAAERVCDVDGGLDVLEATAGLVEKSLVHLRPEGREPRFSMLETIRQYSLDRLASEGSASLMRDRHADYYREVITDARMKMRTGEQETTLQMLLDESGNVRSALDHMIASGRHGEAADASWALWNFWWLGDRLDEGIRFTEPLIESPAISERQRALVRSSYGFMLFWRGDYATSLALMLQALDGFRAIGDDEGIAYSQIPLGLIGATVVGPEDSLPRFVEARAIFERQDDRWGCVVARNAEVWLQLGLGTELSQAELEETVEMARSMGTEIELGMSYGNLGAYQVRAGKLDDAARSLEITLRALLKHRIRNMATYTLDQVAELAVARGDDEEGARLFGAADGIRERVGAPLAPVHETPRRAVIERAASRIGQERFDDAVTEGHKVHFRAAMAEAIEYCKSTLAVTTS